MNECGPQILRHQRVLFSSLIDPGMLYLIVSMIPGIVSVVIMKWNNEELTRTIMFFFSFEHDDHEKNRANRRRYQAHVVTKAMQAPTSADRCSQ